MSTNKTGQKTHQRGFTLIEIMIVVAIIGILAAIAYPAYQKYTYSTSRKAAIADILSVQQQVERSYTINNGAYSSGAIGWVDATAGSCDGNGGANTSGVPPRYWLTMAMSSQAYTITATPCSIQSTDSCGTLSIDQDGIRRANNAIDGSCF